MVLFTKQAGVALPRARQLLEGGSGEGHLWNVTSAPSHGASLSGYKQQWKIPLLSLKYLTLVNKSKQFFMLCFERSPDNLQTTPEPDMSGRYWKYHYWDQLCTVWLGV